MVFPNRLYQIAALANTFSPKWMQPLTSVPAVVAAFDNKVDLFIQVLAHIGCPENASLPIKAHAPDVAETVRPDFWACIRLVDERIVLRHGVVLTRILVIHIEAKHFAENRFQILA